MAPPVTRGSRLGNSNTKDPTPLNPNKGGRRSLAPTPTPTEDAEFVDAEEYLVQDKTTGLAYLTKHALCWVDRPMDRPNIISTLHQINQLHKVPLSAREAIRAIAFILEDHEASDIASAVMTHAVTPITKQVKQHVTDSLAAHMADLINASTELRTTSEAIQRQHLSLNTVVNALQDQSNALDSITTAKDSLDSIAPVIETAQQAFASLIEQTTATAQSLSKTNQTDDPCPSYSSILQSAPSLPPPNSRPPHTNTTPASYAKAAIRDRQILVDPHLGQSLFSPNAATLEIANKMGKIIDTLRNEEDPKVEIKAVLKLRNGGLIMELDSLEATTWLHQEGVRERFLDSLGIPAELKRRTYTILVPFLPIRSQIEEADWLRNIELENNLPTDVILSAKWAKPVERRSLEQQVAHVILTLTNPDAANLLLHNGLYVQKTKLHPRKEHKDPVRCAKCQGWGHLARNCLATHDTCATCGDHHRTDSCMKQHRYCVNCNKSGHGSNDPKCPTYLNKRAMLDAKHPENSMPYFPTGDEWTHVTLPPKPTPLIVTPPPPRTPPTEPPRSNGPPQYTAEQPTRGGPSKHARGRTRRGGRATNNWHRTGDRPLATNTGATPSSYERERELNPNMIPLPAPATRQTSILSFYPQPSRPSQNPATAATSASQPILPPSRPSLPSLPPQPPSTQ